MLEIIKSPQNPKYSLFIPFTRDWLVDTFLEHLDILEMPLGSMEFIFYNDTNNQELQGKLREYLTNKTLLNGAKLYCSNNIPPTESDPDERRRRIVEMKQRSRDLVEWSDYTIGLEDDTFPTDSKTIYTLIKHIEGHENIGFVSGVERGRWGFSIIGAWEMDDVNEPTRVSTLPYKASGLQHVDGAGWYAYITPTNLYKLAEYRYEAECLGPDVCYVMDLRRRHYECLVDWSLICGHRTSSHTLYPDSDCMVVEWQKGDNGWILTDKTPVKNGDK